MSFCVTSVAMELREYARAIVESESVDAKLEPAPDDLTDDAPGEPLLLAAPGRSSKLAIRLATEVKVPPMIGFQDRFQRPRILHSMANHEFQAIELFAWALLAFPDAPKTWRRGILGILDEEQRHFRLYTDRLEAGGHEFGDFGVTGYFWNRAGAVTSPIHFACIMGLTFENANLDFAREYGAAARAADDHKTAEAIEEIYRDEIGHVAFGWKWLARWKDPDKSMWDAYTETLTRPLNPGRARGKTFDVEGRRAAGLDEEFIANLEATAPKSPSNKVRT